MKNDLPEFKNPPPVPPIAPRPRCYRNEKRIKKPVHKKSLCTESDVSKMDITENIYKPNLMQRLFGKYYLSLVLIAIIIYLILK